MLLRGSSSTTKPSRPRPAALGVIAILSAMRSGISSGVIGLAIGALIASFAEAGEGEGGSLSAILSGTSSGVTGLDVSASTFCTDRFFVVLPDIGDEGVELEVITKGDDDFGERGLSNFSMTESRFEVVILMSGRV